VVDVDELGRTVARRAGGDGVVIDDAEDVVGADQSLGVEGRLVDPGVGLAPDDVVEAEAPPAGCAAGADDGMLSLTHRA
jgi:hypothetical protein